jgi:hypothetical protein
MDKVRKNFFLKEEQDFHKRKYLLGEATNATLKEIPLISLSKTLFPIFFLFFEWHSLFLSFYILTVKL